MPHWWLTKLKISIFFKYIYKCRSKDRLDGWQINTLNDSTIFAYGFERRWPTANVPWRYFNVSSFLFFFIFTKLFFGRAPVAEELFYNSHFLTLYVYVYISTTRCKLDCELRCECPVSMYVREYEINLNLGSLTQALWFDINFFLSKRNDFYFFIQNRVISNR